MYLKLTIQERLKDLRTEQKLTLEQLAERTGISKSALGKYETEEGCLSLPGVRKTKRYYKIKVQYQTETFQTRIKTFSGWTAQIIQHEIDHCNGVLI